MLACMLMTTASIKVHQNENKLQTLVSTCCQHISSLGLSVFHHLVSEDVSFHTWHINEISEYKTVLLFRNGFYNFSVFFSFSDSI